MFSCLGQLVVNVHPELVEAKLGPFVSTYAKCRITTPQVSPELKRSPSVKCLVRSSHGACMVPNFLETQTRHTGSDPRPSASFRDSEAGAGKYLDGRSVSDDPGPLQLDDVVYRYEPYCRKHDFMHGIVRRCQHGFAREVGGLAHTCTWVFVG